MSDLTVNGLRPIAPLSAGTKPASGGAGGDDFAAMLRGQLEQVSRMQSEADEDLKRLMAGQSDSVTDVLVTARKADVAFTC